MARCLFLSSTTLVFKAYDLDLDDSGNFVKFEKLNNLILNIAEYEKITDEPSMIQSHSC